MSEEFKTTGSISMSQINHFISENSRASTPEIRDEKSIGSLFDLMNNYQFDLPNGNFNQPHQFSEMYGAVSPGFAWNLPNIESWGRLFWDGTYRNIPWRIGEYNTTNSDYRDTYVTFTTTRYSSNSPAGRFVTYRATSYAKDAGVAHPLPTEIKNENVNYGFWAANASIDWGRLVGIWNGVEYSQDYKGPNVFHRSTTRPMVGVNGSPVGAVYEVGASHTNTSSTSILLSTQGAWSVNSTFAAYPPTPETKSLQDSIMYWDTNDIPYLYTNNNTIWHHGLAVPYKLLGNLEQFARFSNYNNNTASINGSLTPSNTDFHLKIQSRVDNTEHIVLEEGSYTNNNAIFDEYKTIYYQTGLIYIRGDQTTGSNRAINLNFNECPNGYIKIEIGASPEYIIVPWDDGTWKVIGAEDITSNGSTFDIKSTVSYIQSFPNKAGAVSHWMNLQYGDHAYQMNTNARIYKSSYTGGWKSPSRGTPGRRSKIFNYSTKSESDWQFVLGQRTKGDNSEFPSYWQYDYYVDDGSSINSIFNLYDSGFFTNTAKRPRTKGSKYKFDLLYHVFKEKNFFGSNTRLSNEDYMPRMHTGLKIEVKYIIELRMSHQIQIERAVRYCEKLDSANSFQILYVWPFNEEFAENYGATIPTLDPVTEVSNFLVIGHKVLANNDVKYLHINTAALSESTDLYNDAVTAIRNAFSV